MSPTAPGATKSARCKHLVGLAARAHRGVPVLDPSAILMHTGGMKKLSLDAQAREHLELAKAGSTGRSSETVYGGHENVLRQTVIALTAGSSLAEHAGPGEATIQVLRGRVRLSSGDTSWEGRAGDLIEVPPTRHSLEALEDSAVLLTAAVRA